MRNSPTTFEHEIKTLLRHKQLCYSTNIQFPMPNQKASAQTHGKSHIHIHK